MSAFSWPSSRQTVLDLNGDVVPGARLNFYNAGTTTPLVVFSDSALSVPLPAFPDFIEADATGRWPRVFMPYVDYKEAVTAPSGVVLWVDDGIANPAPASSGGGGTVPDDQLVKTGFVRIEYSNGPMAGYVRLNGLTIGNAGSGATERANDDTEDLFIWLWTRLSNTVCPVSGGRGGSAASDYAAGKTLGLPREQGRNFVGVDAMGGTSSGLLTPGMLDTGSIDATGSHGGTSFVTLSTVHLPIITPTGIVTITNAGSVAGPAFTNATGSTAPPNSNAYWTSSGGTLTVTGTTAVFTGDAFGGNQAHPNMQPFTLMTFYIKL